MQAFSDTIQIRPSIAEQRPAIRIPAPCDGSAKSLRDEHKMLQARADALESDRSLAAQHRSDFARELEEMTETAVVVEDKPKTMKQAIAEVTGIVAIEEDRSIAWEATQVRDISLGLLRKELGIRGDLSGYLKRWLIEARKAVDNLRAKHVKVQADILNRLIEFGYDDPAIHKLSPSRVLPGYIFCHPEVRAAKNEFEAVNGLMNGTKWIPENAKEIEELRRLIRSEAARLAGLSVG